MAKTNAKGRSRESRHVRIYRYIWETLLGRLDGNSFKALFYMLTFEDGSNNGQVYMGARKLSEGIGVDKKTALRCLQHLDRQGFIRPEQLGYFQQKGGPATKWRFTFLPANGRPPTNEWRQPPSEEKSWGHKFPDAGGKIGPAHSTHRVTVGKIGPVEALSGDSMGGKMSTQTVAIAEDTYRVIVNTRACERYTTNPRPRSGPDQRASADAVPAVEYELDYATNSRARARVVLR